MNDTQLTINDTTAKSFKKVDNAFPSNYEIIDSYSVGDESGWRIGNYHNYGASPLQFVRERGKGYGIISIKSHDANNQLNDNNIVKEVIPCKYDAIYSNGGKQIIDLNGNFFLHEEQDEKGNSYDVGVGNDILFVKYQNDFMECDYFCENMLALSGEKNKFKEEHFVCKEFNQYYYIDVTGKYCLRKKYRDSNTYEKVNLFKVYVGNNEFCGGYVREEEYTTIIEAINGNHRVIIINEYTLWDDWSGLHSGRTFPTSRFEIHSDFDEILGIIIEIEFKDTISLRVRRGYKVLNIVVELVRNRKGNPTISNMFDYPIIENLLIMRTHDELVKQPHLFFDTETTGVPKDYKAPSYDTRNWPRLVQLAWILTDDKGHLIYSRNLIIKPDGFDIPSEAVIVHGISTQKALEAGIPLKEVIEQFQIALNVAECIVGHNVAFDKKIVGAEMIRLGLKDIMDSKKSHCTMQSSIDFCKIPGKYGYKYPKLQELYKKLFGIEFDNAHNAMSDIEATEKCFWELRKRKLI